MPVFKTNLSPDDAANWVERAFRSGCGRGIDNNVSSEVFPSAKISVSGVSNPGFHSTTRMEAIIERNPDGRGSIVTLRPRHDNTGTSDAINEVVQNFTKKWNDGI